MLLHIFVETMHLIFSGFFDEYKEYIEMFITHRKLFEVFTVTFDESNASLLNKRINFFQNKTKTFTDPKCLSSI